MRRELRLFGAGEEDIDQLIGAIGGEQDDYPVWPMNLATLRVFQGLATQWRLAPMGEPIGLDYAAITPTVLRGLGVSRETWPEIFTGLRFMESGALDEFSAGRPGKRRTRASPPQ